jgi:Zn finger protein HypA/HybF involved in hydrogenase expression
MIINNDRRPIDLICPKCKTRVMVTTGPDGPIATESRTIGAIKIKCPRCREPITISSDRRPLRIECPKCGANGTIRGYDSAHFDHLRSPTVRGGHGNKRPKVVKCVGCGEKIIIKTDVRPLVVTCPRCRMEGKISK